jgi:glucose/arabinose dehydrogenase
LRRVAYGSPEPAWGSTPAIPAAKPQGRIPTLKMPTAQGWAHGQTPAATPGLKVNAFATGLKRPRWIDVLPSGDVLVAESTTVPGDCMRNIFDYAMVATMQRAAAAADCGRRSGQRAPRLAEHHRGGRKRGTQRSACGRVTAVAGAGSHTEGRGLADDDVRFRLAGGGKAVPGAGTPGIRTIDAPASRCARALHGRAARAAGDDGRAGTRAGLCHLSPAR